MTNDECVALLPYFKIQTGKLDAFKGLCAQFLEKTKTEPGCLYYAFTFDGDMAHCREGYVDAQALLDHLQNVGALLGESLQISELYRLEAHGPERELEKLRHALAPFQPQYFKLDSGFRR